MMGLLSFFSKGHRISSHLSGVLANKSRRCLHCVSQHDRGLLQVRGPEAGSFLQGLITNDITHLQEGATSMYSMVLNAQGRVVYDIIVYNVNHKEGASNMNNNSQGGSNVEDYLIETDVTLVESLVRILKMYRLRKKIDIESVCDTMNCWALFDPNIACETISTADIECLYVNPKVDAKVELNISEQVQGMIVTRDPRMKYIGHKLVLPKEVNASDIISGLTSSDLECYTNLRYRLGFAEGRNELPSGNVTPLEANVDYLHGVSFHKGCYIGQELTARVHHTGVVRKRYMPLVFPTSVPDIPLETNIVNSKGKRVGRVRAHKGRYGIGLLRVADCLADASGLKVGDNSVTTFKPAWWPIEASKEKKN